MTVRSTTSSMIALALVVAACSGGGGPTDSVESGVGIEATGCALTPSVASGAVAIEPDIVVASAHVVAGAGGLTVIDHSGARHDAVVVGFDPAADVAVLRVAGLLGAPLAIEPAEQSAGGELISFAPDLGVRSTAIRITKHLLVTIEDIYIENTVERAALEFTGPIEHGDSGGVIVVDGAIVGLVYARSRDRAGIGFAVDHTEILDAIDQRVDSGVDHSRCVP